MPAILTELRIAEIAVNYRFSSSRLLLLDYDGTLVNFQNNPEAVIPGNDVLEVITKLSSDSRNTVALITGRSQSYMAQWFGEMNAYIFAEHGAVVKERNKNQWIVAATKEQLWKQQLLSLLKPFADEMPGSIVEQKVSSIVLHYRNVEPDLAYAGIKALSQFLEEAITPDMNLKIAHGKKIVEIKQKEYDKKTASKKMLALKKFNFILSIGDDHADEDMFGALPVYAYAVRVGYGESKANFSIENPREVINFFRTLLIE